MWRRRSQLLSSTGIQAHRSYVLCAVRLQELVAARTGTPNDDSGDSPHDRASLERWLSLLRRAPYEEDKEAKEKEEESGHASGHLPEAEAGDHLPTMQMLGTPETEFEQPAARSSPPRGALKRRRADSPNPGHGDLAFEEAADEDTSHAGCQCSQLQWDKNFLLECPS